MLAGSTLGLAALVIAGCSSSGSGHESRGSAATSHAVIKVVAAENFWGNIVGQIGGSHVSVTSIISDPNTDPHEYESDPHDAAAIAKANLVDKLLSVSPSSHRDVVSVQKILNITGDNPNPHVWYDTAKLPDVATAIAQALTNLDPTDSATFTANAATFDTSLTPILTDIAEIKAKYTGTKIAYTERVPGYLTDAAGLVLGVPASFTQAVEEGNDPSPSDTAAFDSAINNKTVKVLLYNGQVVDSETTQIKNLAQSSGVRSSPSPKRSRPPTRPSRPGNYAKPKSYRPPSAPPSRPNSATIPGRVKRGEPHRLMRG